MNDDFEEEYEDEDYDDYDLLEDAKDLYDDIKDIKNKYKTQEGNGSNFQKEAQNFDKQLRDKNIARTQNPEAVSAGGASTSSASATTATTGTATAGTATGTAATGTAAASAATTGAAATGTAVAGTAAAGTAAAGTTAAATAGTTAAVGGAVAAQAAIPVAGWIALAAEAIIAAIILVKKALKKHDEKMAESGVDSKGLRKLLKASPILLPFAIVILIIIILVQSETQEKVDFLNQALKCFESEKGCKDFMNTGEKISGIGADLIRATDLQIAGFVISYVKAENKYYGSDGSSFMSDVVNDLNEIAKEGVIEDGDDIFEKIKEWLQELVDNSIIGDINYAWNLIKWMKVEKRVYQNITWYKAHLDTAAGYTLLDTLKEWASVGLLKQDPNIAFGTTVTKEALAVDLNLFNSYLPTPLDIEVDTCIEAARPYIPSWLEIYAVYVSTGDYDIANDIYNYYIDKDNYKLEVTLYELTTVTQTEHVEGKKTTKYKVEKDGKTDTLTEEEYEKAIKEDSGFFSWLGDKLSDLIESAKELLSEIGEWIKNFLGFNVKVSTEYVPIVTYGNAFKYRVNQEYKITCEETFEIKKAQNSKSKESGHKTIEYESGKDDNGNAIMSSATYYVETVTKIDYHITTWTNKLKYISTNITEYDEDNRLSQIFVDMVEENDYKYTIDDIAIAVEIIESFYGESYTKVGGSIDYSALPDGDFGWPVPANKVVSALFGYTAWYGGNHGGIDIWAVNSVGNPTADFSFVGKIDVVAAQKGTVINTNDGCADGNVVSKNCGDTYGNYVMIEHENNYITVYGHLARGTVSVQVGQEVEAGRYLGKMGSSGNSSGTHLHFEIRFDGTRVDPLAFYDVVPYNYNVSYDSRNGSGITMANPYKVNFQI